MEFLFLVESDLLLTCKLERNTHASESKDKVDSI
jgi:hypothetical protein